MEEQLEAVDCAYGTLLTVDDALLRNFVEYFLDNTSALPRAHPELPGPDKVGRSGLNGSGRDDERPLTTIRVRVHARWRRAGGRWLPERPGTRAVAWLPVGLMCTLFGS